MDTTIEDFLNAFDFSPNTEDKYRRALKLLFESKGDLSDMSASQFRDWLQSHGWGNSQQQVNLYAVKKFLRWRYGELHPALFLKLKRIESPPGRSLSEEQVYRLLTHFNTSRPKGRRDLAMCLLFLESALRCSEMCNLLLSKWNERRCDKDGWVFDAFVKGRKWRSAWCSYYTAEWVNTWLVDRESVAKPGVKSVFVSVGGDTPGQSLTRDGLGSEFRRLSDELGFKVSPHDLRRTFGNETARAGASSRVAMLAGGWKTEKAYRRYTLALTPADIAPYSPVLRVLGLNHPKL